MNGVDNQEQIIYCTRCGEPMKASARYCMKCGNLNYDHEANKNMRPYIKDNVNTYQVGEGKFMVDNKTEDRKVSIANNTGNRLVCFLFNYIPLVLILGFITYNELVNCNFDVLVLIHSGFGVASALIGLSFLWSYGFQLTVMKCNQRWWSIFIPIYSILVLSEITLNNKYFGLLTYVPGIGIIVSLMMFYNLGNKFDHSGILTVIAPFIMIPIIGFGANGYEGVMFIEDGDVTNAEKDYKLKKIFLSTALIFIIIGVASVVLSYVI